ncbi:MAG: glycosyltransferase [Planctomycetales bacterium]
MSDDGPAAGSSSAEIGPGSSLLIAALEHAEIELSLEPGLGDGERVEESLARLRGLSENQRPEVWITSGLSPSKPDLLGPALSAEWDLPYVLLQPSVEFIDAEELPEAGPVRQALALADKVISTNTRVVRSLLGYAANQNRVIHLLPFIDTAPDMAAYQLRHQQRTQMAAQLQLQAGTPWILAAANMEPGDALESYRFLARGMSRILSLDWSLIILGDGPSRVDVEQALGALPRDRARIWSSSVPKDRINLFNVSDVYAWPALGDCEVDTLLEAQASASPVVASAGSGTADRMIDATTGKMTQAENPESFGQGVGFLLRHQPFRESYANQAREQAATNHDLRPAGKALRGILKETVKNRP